MVTRYGQADVPREVSGRGGPAVRPAAADFPRDVCLTVSRNHAVFTILTKSPSWSSLLPIVLRTRRGAMRSGPTSQCPLEIHGSGQINTANSMLSSRELTTTALYLITPFEQGAIILC